MRISAATAFALMVFCLAPLPAQAENSTKSAGYTIHHNALSTATLSPEIATNYQIVRSKYQGMLNVSVIRDQAGTTGQAVTARVKAKSTNLAGQIRDIPLREIKEGDAVYYIGVFPIVGGETLRFDLQVTPRGLTQPLEAKLSQDFFID